MLRTLRLPRLALNPSLLPLAICKATRNRTMAQPPCLPTRLPLTPLLKLSPPQKASKLLPKKLPSNQLIPFEGEKAPRIAGLFFARHSGQKKPLDKTGIISYYFFMIEKPKAPDAAESAQNLYETLTEHLRTSAATLEYTGPDSIPLMRAKLAHQSWILDRLFALALDDSICKTYIDREKAQVALKTQNQYRHTVLTIENLRSSANRLLKNGIDQESGLTPAELDSVFHSVHQRNKEQE